MRQHHALRRAGGARRVDEGGQPVRLRARRAARSRAASSTSVAVGHELVPGQHHRVVRWPAPLHHHDVAQVGEHRPLTLHDLLELVLVLDQHDRRLGVVDDVAAPRSASRWCRCRRAPHRPPSPRRRGSTHSGRLKPRMVTGCPPARHRGRSAPSPPADLVGVLPPRDLAPCAIGLLGVVGRRARPASRRWKAPCGGWCRSPRRLLSRLGSPGYFSPGAGALAGGQARATRSSSDSSKKVNPPSGIISARSGPRARRRSRCHGSPERRCL